MDNEEHIWLWRIKSVFSSFIQRFLIVLRLGENKETKPYVNPRFAINIQVLYKKLHMLSKNTSKISQKHCRKCLETTKSAHRTSG